MVRRFLQSGRSGFYFAVVEEGEAAAGAPVERVARDPEGISIADLARLYRSKDPDPELLRRALGSPALSGVWRAGIQKRLEALESSRG
jgi:MOSC domain-containing protein YiiM